MSSNGGITRVSIPGNVRKTIQNIKEIGVKHSDEDVYAMLKECGMDPNETVQRLLSMDTFHEVKRKRDKKRENFNGGVYEDSGRKPSNQGRAARSGRGSFSSQSASNDVGGGRNAAFRKEIGLDGEKEKNHKPASPYLKDVNSRRKSPAAVNGRPTGLPNGDANVGRAVQTSQSIDKILQKGEPDDSLVKPEIALSQSKVKTENVPSASDPVVDPMKPCDTQLPTSVSAIESKHGSLRSLAIAVEMKDSANTGSHLGNSCELVDQSQIKAMHGSEKDSSPRSEHSECVDTVHSKISQELSASGKLSSPLIDNTSAAGPMKDTEEPSLKLEKLKISEGQQVILPNHIQVPEAVKNILSFGSLDSCLGGATDIKTSEVDRISNQTSEEILEDEIPKKPESSDEDIPSTAQGDNYPDPPLASETETSPPLENKDSVSKEDQQKQETLPAVGLSYPVVPTPTYSFGFIPPMIGNPLLQVESHDHHQQPRIPNSMNGNLPVMPASTSTPPPNSAGGVQSSAVMPMQPLPLLHQPYPPNIIPYPHFLSPYFMPPPVQFVGHGGFPQQLPTGNMYMPTTAANAPGMKMSAPGKPGNNLSNQMPVPLPSSAYGVFGSHPVGHPSTVVTSGSSNANGDLGPTLPKENSVYLGQQSEGSMVWIPGPGRESPNLPMNSLFNLPHQGQHLPITQAGHPAFASAFHHHPLHTLGGPVVSHPLLQHSQSMAPPVEPMGLPPPPNAFPPPPPQRHQINWNSGF